MEIKEKYQRIIANIKQLIYVHDDIRKFFTEDLNFSLEDQEPIAQKSMDYKMCFHVRSVLVRIVFRANLSGDQYRKASTMLEIVYNIRR